MVGCGDLQDHRDTANCIDLPGSALGNLRLHCVDAGKHGPAWNVLFRWEKAPLLCCPDGDPVNGPVAGKPGSQFSRVPGFRQSEVSHMLSCTAGSSDWSKMFYAGPKPLSNG